MVCVFFISLVKRILSLFISLNDYYILYILLIVVVLYRVAVDGNSFMLIIIVYSEKTHFSMILRANIDGICFEVCVN